MKRFFVLISVIAILAQLVLEGVYFRLLLGLLKVLLTPTGVIVIFLFLLYHYIVVRALIAGFRKLFDRKPLSGVDILCIVISVFCNPAFFIFIFPYLGSN